MPYKDPDKQRAYQRKWMRDYQRRVKVEKTTIFHLLKLMPKLMRLPLTEDDKTILSKCVDADEMEKALVYAKKLIKTLWPGVEAEANQKRRDNEYAAQLKREVEVSQTVLPEREAPVQRDKLIVKVKKVRK